VAKKKLAKKQPTQKKKPTKKVMAKKVIAKKTIVKKALTKKVTAKKVTAKKNAKKAYKKPVMKAAQKPAKKSTDYSKAVTPLGNRIVVRLISAERMTPGGLIIPDMVSTTEGQLKAEVLAVGSGTKNKKGYVQPLDVQKGDTILFSEHSGTKVIFNSEELHIVQESDVLGVLQK